MAFTFFRLAFSDPINFYEQMGDPITSVGGSPVPAQRGALRHSVALMNLPANVAEETVGNRLKLRRQVRSLINNTPMKLQGVYLGWDADPENNGWYMPDQGQLVDIEGSVGLATGIFKVENFVWVVAGRPRTHRRAAWIWIKDLRTGLWARDFRRLIYNTDFATLTPLNITYLAPGISDPLTTGGSAKVPLALPAGADGSQCYVLENLADLARLSYEQAKASIVQGCVLAYDRRGELTGPINGPGTSWEEFYGPDYPYSWMEALSQADTPVLDNGRCRVRYDPANIPGFVVDTWTGVKWEEQFKLTIGRLNGITNPLMDTLVNAALVEYNETRAVLQCVMRASIDQNSREEVFITLQRGWSGPRFEVYPAGNATEKVDAYMSFSTVAADTDNSAIKIDTSETGAGAIVATAVGTGHTGLFPVSAIGAATFTGANLLCLGRWGKTYGLALAVLRSTLSPATTGSISTGPFRNAIQIAGSSKDGYLSVHTGIPLQSAEQAIEAEAFTRGTNSNEEADAEASGGKCVGSARTSDANPHITKATWLTARRGWYRVFVKVRKSGGPGAMKFYAKNGSTTGATVTVAEGTTTYTWVDLGEVHADGSTLEIHAWQVGAAGPTTKVDRVEAFQLEDRESSGLYQAARDLGGSVLMDQRTIPTLVSRAN